MSYEVVDIREFGYAVNEISADLSSFTGNEDRELFERIKNFYQQREECLCFWETYYYHKAKIDSMYKSQLAPIQDEKKAHDYLEIMLAEEIHDLWELANQLSDQCEQDAEDIFSMKAHTVNGAMAKLKLAMFASQPDNLRKSESNESVCIREDWLDKAVAELERLTLAS